MSRTPRPLARRLDRLARRAHAFHRFAHHPLCAAYAGETVLLGRRTRICRGCLLTALGGLAGAAMGLLLPGPPAAALGPLSLLYAGVAWAATGPRAAEANGRPAPARKWSTRALPMALGAWLAASGLVCGDRAGIAVTAACLAATALAVRRYRLRGPDRGPCRACPEAAGPATCSGFQRALRRERAFARLAGALLSGNVPGWIRARSAGAGEGGP